MSDPVATVERGRVTVALADVVADARTLEPEALRRFGTTLVVAPHPDDESLGCGGLLALLGATAQPVWALLVTDGTLSHPNSRCFDAAARAALRRREWHAALDRLGVGAARRRRLGLADGAVPERGQAQFDAAVASVAALLAAIAPATLVLPWRRDPHPDHRATHSLLVAALAAAGLSPRCLEYGVWISERAATADLPQPGETRAWRLDIATVVELKRGAIAAHRSQHGEVIDDDPRGFTIAPSMRRRAEAPIEYFFEARLP